MIKVEWKQMTEKKKKKKLVKRTFFQTKTAGVLSALNRFVDKGYQFQLFDYSLNLILQIEILVP